LFICRSDAESKKAATPTEKDAEVPVVLEADLAVEGSAVIPNLVEVSGCNRHEKRIIHD